MTDDELVLLARDVLTEAPVSEILSYEKIQGLIRTALDQTVRRLSEESSDTRERFRVRTTSLLVTGGMLDLSTQAAAGAVLEMVGAHDIKVTIDFHGNPTVFPLEPVYSRARLEANGRQDGFFVLGFLDGVKFYLKDPSGFTLDSLIGTADADLVTVPATAEDWPTGLEPELILGLAKLAELELMRDAKARRPQAG